MCKCPQCDKKIIVDIRIEGFETMTFESDEQAKQYVLDNVSLTVVYDTHKNTHNTSLIEVHN